MSTQEERDIEEIVSRLIENRNNKTMGISRIIQGIILAGIIGLFVQFNEVKESITISTTERANFKEDIQELKADVRSLRYTLYANGYTTENKDKDNQ